MTITGKIQKRLCAGAALAMLAAALLMPAQAAGAPHVTPDTTVAEMRANEGIMGSGVNTWDRGDLLPEQPWMYGHWTLRRFIGPTVEDGVAGLNLIIDNYNQGVQVTYPIYTPEEIAADPSLAEVELYYFPATQPGAKYALVLAGNMFERTSVVKEACGAVSQLHEMGYGAFILRYRIGRDLKDNANYKDLVRAVQFRSLRSRPRTMPWWATRQGGSCAPSSAPTGWGTAITACPSPGRCCWPTPSSIICTANLPSFTSTTGRSRGITWRRGTTITTSRWRRK